MEFIAILKLIHLSDLHFGTESPAIVDALIKAIEEIAPNYAILSGDFTQVGSREEFELAQSFINKLPCETLCVPGNHDVPAYNLIERFVSPFDKYKHYIQDELNPFYHEKQITIAGLNSARRCLAHWNWANGAISASQRKFLKKRMENDQSAWRICFFHHPIHKVDEMPLDVTVFGRKRTLKTLHDLKFDLVLTGHVHHASISTLGDEEHQTIYLSASTALSSRTRSQENGFNVISLHDDQMHIDIYALQGNSFSIMKSFSQKKHHHESFSNSS